MKNRRILAIILCMMILFGSVSNVGAAEVNDQMVPETSGEETPEVNDQAVPETSDEEAADEEEMSGENQNQEVDTGEACLFVRFLSGEKSA